MKKIALLVLSIVMIIALTACGGTSTEGGNNGGPGTVETQEVGTDVSGYVTVPKGDWTPLHDETSDYSLFYNNDSGGSVDIYNTMIKNEGNALSIESDIAVSYFETDFGSKNVKVEDGKFGDVDARIITGTYKNETSNEELQLYGWVFPDKDNNIVRIVVEASPADINQCVETINGTYVFKK